MKKTLLLFAFILNVTISHLSAQTVYITDTGEKYHRSDCRYLSHSKHAVELKNAIENGYEACKICKPPQSISSSKNKTETQTKESTSENNNATTVQCSGTTKAGNRCKRMTKSANGLCYQHGGS